MLLIKKTVATANSSVWLNDTVIWVIDFAIVNFLTDPDKNIIGCPVCSDFTSISFSLFTPPNPPNPMPSALRHASFAAKRAAKCGNGLERAEQKDVS